LSNLKSQRIRRCTAKATYQSSHPASPGRSCRLVDTGQTVGTTLSVAQPAACSCDAPRRCAPPLVGKSRPRCRPGFRVGPACETSPAGSIPYVMIVGLSAGAPPSVDLPFETVGGPSGKRRRPAPLRSLCPLAPLPCAWVCATHKAAYVRYKGLKYFPGSGENGRLLAGCYALITRTR
jgi:hypothetical protein